MLRIMLFLDFSCRRQTSRRLQPKQQRRVAGMGHDVTSTDINCISGWTCYAVNQWATKSPESGYLEVISLQARRTEVFKIVIIKNVDTEAAEAL